MGILNRQKNNINKCDNYELFSNWIDKILEQGISEGIIAFNFNLYEGTGTYDIQLIGSDNFDVDDSDWACTDFFTTGENICYIKRTKDIKHWDKGLDYITKLTGQYLSVGRNAHILKSVNAIGIGFVDGDINIIYRT